MTFPCESGFRGESLQWAPQWDFAIFQWDFSGGGALKGNLYNEPPNEILQIPQWNIGFVVGIETNEADVKMLNQ